MLVPKNRYTVWCHPIAEKSMGGRPASLQEELLEFLSCNQKAFLQYSSLQLSTDYVAGCLRKERSSAPPALPRTPS